MIYTYTDDQKARIKSNPLNRQNCKAIREITTIAYREYQKAQLARESVMAAGAIKAAEAELLRTKDIYEARLCKFNLYKELFPDLVQ